MRRDFSKNRFDRHRPSKRRAPVLLIGLIVLLSGIGWVGYQYKKHPENFPVASANFSRLAAWLSYKKQDEQAEVKNKAVAVAAASTEKKIHFEFYTALPNMHMKPSKPVDEKTVATPILPSEKVEVADAATTTHEATKPGFISHQELERDFSDSLSNQQPYVVQLGVFGNMEAANGYKQSLHRAGLKVDVVKIAMNGKTAYRVQFGPYSNKDQARVVQKQLQKKNVSALVRKAVAL